MIRTIWNAAGGEVSVKAAVYVGMMFAAPLLGLLRPGRALTHWAIRMNKRDIQEMGRNGQYKQEILLFGLTDWVIGKWKTAVEKEKEIRTTQHASTWRMGVGIMRDSVRSTVLVSLLQASGRSENMTEAFLGLFHRLWWH